jgi:hypothetical protein
MKNINPSLMAQFIYEAGERLSGKWLLLGGALMPALGIVSRVTVDIDFVRISKEPSDPTLDLLKLAEKLKLPAGTINQAALFYLRKIKRFANHLVQMHKGSKATIYRPKATLFLQLKLNRLTESDAMDCIEYLRFLKKHKTEMEEQKLLNILLQKTKSPLTDSQSQRIQKLIAEIKGF